MNQATRIKDGFSLLQKGAFFFTVAIMCTLLLAVFVYYEIIDSNAHNPLLLAGGFLALLITLIAGLFMFVRDITLPLMRIDRATRQMREGRLDHLAKITTKDEIGMTGERINDLAINTQELLLLFWNHTHRNNELIETLEVKEHALSDGVGLHEDMVDIFTELKQGNMDMKSFMSGYEFFDLKLEQERMVINTRSEGSN